ncbi:MAG: histidine kinase [Ignavibacteriales bacterium]|nr:histidine kinase [Ignavibacteriales bacterium]
MLKKIQIFTLLSFLQFASLFSQTPSYYHYTSSDGMASSTVFDIMQDKDGFIWFGTLNGLNKFDGKHFTTFNVKDGLNSNVITSLVEGDSGEIYLGNYEKGINILKDGKIENYRDRINGKNFNTTYLLNYHGKIYTYTNYSIFITDQNSKTNFTDHIIEPLPFYLLRIAKLLDNKLVVLTSKGLYKITNNLLFKMNIAGLPDTNFYCLAERSDGSYFIGARGSIYLVKNNRVIKKISIDSHHDKMFYHIFCDKENNIWFSILGKGFFLIPNNSSKIIEMGSKMGLENTQVDCFYEDSEGNIWIGTYGKGVYCLNNLYIKNYTENDGLNNNNVISIEKEKSGRLLIGTINGISILQNGVVERVKDNSGKDISGYINSINSFDDYMYVCWAPENPEIKNVSCNGLKFRFIVTSSFYKTMNGSYLYGSIGNSISSFNGYYNKRTDFHSIQIFGDSTIQNRVNVILEDKRKNIWVGTSLGLCKLSGSSGKSEITNFNKTFFKDDPVLSSKINSIYEDTKNNIWFTGAKGFAKYNLNNNSVTSYTSILNHDLSTTTSVVSDSKNRIWVGSMKGLYLIDGNSIKLLNSKTGLPSDEVLALNYDSGTNILYIGTSNGLSSLDVNMFDNYKHLPLEVKINSIRVNQFTYSSQNNLVLQPDQNNVYLNFRVINYSSPGSVQFRYILNGDVRETKNDFLDFSSLKYGVYNLQIMAKDQNTDWGKPYLITFRILPHFIETIWFNLIIMTLLIITALLILSWRLKLNREKNNEQLELTERINDLKHQALSAMMNPHFISNSLNSVQYLVNTQRYEEANDYIAMMAKLMRKNLDTAGSGFILLYEEISRLKLYLDLEKLRFQDSFSYEIITGTDVHTGYLMIPNMIIQPFVENSLWHGIMDSGIKGLLTVSFSFEDVEIDSSTVRSLIIKVTDNGIGLKEAMKKKEEDHISRGIQIIEERLKLLSAKMNLPQPIMFEDLSIRDENAHGTEIIISLPPPLYKIINPDSDHSFSGTD